MPGLDLRQIMRRDRQLDRARHRKGAGAVDADGAASGEVDDRDADLAARQRRDPVEFALARWLGRQLRQLQRGTQPSTRAVRLAAFLAGKPTL